MKKIAILISDITRAAGTERAVCNLANILTNLNYNIYIISTNSKDGNAYYELNNNITIEHLNLKLNSKSFSKMASYVKLIKYVNENFQGYDFIIGTFLTFNCILSWFSKKAKNIGCEHFNYSHANLIQKFIRKISYKRLAATVVLTKNDSAHYGFLNQDKLFIIPNSLSFSPIRKNTYDQKIILSIGRLSYQKGFDRLIEIANIIRADLLGWKILIVGDGDLKSELQDQIIHYNLENLLEILPPTPEIISVYQSASIYAMTSRFEGLPMVLIEAQSCGLPIISFDCPEGPSEVVKDGINGYLIENNEIEKFATKLKILINDCRLREKLGQEAYNNSNLFTPCEIEKKWINLLENIQ